MKASSIITRALNLADLQNAAFIQWNDKAQSLYESYRDIYADLIDAEDDFFLVDTQIAVTQSMQSVNQSGSMVQEWLVPLPTDCMKIRYVFYRGTQSWLPMDKFEILDATVVGSPPRYRWQNGNLWIVGNSMFSMSTIRVGYYPQQPIATVPDDDYVYGSGITPLANRSLVTYPVYCDQNQSLLYVYNGLNIQIDSVKLKTSSIVLYTGATTMSHLKYHAGYVYFLMGGNIYRAPFIQTGTLIPVAVTSVANITSFSISIFDNLIYYTDGTNIHSMTPGGSSVTLVASYPGSSVYNFADQFTFYVDPSGNLKTTDGTTLSSGVVSALTDGSTFIFYLDTKSRLYCATVVTTSGVPSLQSKSAAGIVTSPLLLREKVSAVGPFSASGPIYPSGFANVVSGRIPLIDWTLDILAVSSIVDYDFGYPLNETNEIMAYQAAIDFLRKMNKDFSALATRLGQRAQDRDTGSASGLWARFESAIIRRDEFRPERTANVYAGRMW